jgi:hypothetical protein
MRSTNGGNALTCHAGAHHVGACVRAVKGMLIEAWGHALFSCVCKRDQFTRTCSMQTMVALIPSGSMPRKCSLLSSRLSCMNIGMSIPPCAARAQSCHLIP